MGEISYGKNHILIAVSSLDCQWQDGGVRSLLKLTRQEMMTAGCDGFGKSNGLGPQSRTSEGKMQRSLGCRGGALPSSHSFPKPLP